jgi:long-chain fatty acid transport protein
MTRLLTALAACLIACGLAFPAVAGPHRLIGYDSWSVGRSNSQSAYGASPGVLYSNPALLTDLEDQFGLGIILIQPSLKATLMERPPNADVPITFYDSDVGIEGSNLDRPLPTVELPNQRANNNRDSLSSYLAIGLVHSLGCEDFRLGLTMLVPASGLIGFETYYPDERDQYFSNTVHFTRFGEWSEVFTVLLGAAYRPLDWLSVGASVETSLNAKATLNAFVPEATVQDYALANLSMDADPIARAIVGVNARPLEMLSFSVVWRDRRFFKMDTDALLNLWNYHEPGDTTVPKRVKQDHLLALDFEPMEVSLAAGVHFDELTAEVSVTWNHWADYLDVHHQRAQETAVFEPTNPDDPEIEGGPFAFSDTWSVGAGVAWEYLQGFTATGGLAYRPSPVPAQTGRTNYVDNDILSASLGHRFNFSLWDRSLQVDVGLQFIYMLNETVHKDFSMIRDEFADRARTLIDGQPMSEAQGLQTNNPGFPGYEFGGWSLAGSVSLSYLF